MATVWNIRGTNGSGKTTLARAFLPPDLKGDARGGPVDLKGDARGGPVDLSWYDAPTKRDPGRRLRYPGYISAMEGGDILVLGHYDDGCGGMDRHPAGKGFAVPQAAIWHALGRGAPPCFVPVVEHVICEGVLASGVYGSWAALDDALVDAGHRLAFVYLHTPAEECLRRIQARREAAGSPPKAGPDWDRMVANVTGKWQGTMVTREKAIREGRLVYDLPPFSELPALRALVAGLKVAREVYRARA